MDEKFSIDDLATFCKRKGFVYPSGEIYGGLAGFWDFGPNGVELKNNLKREWWKFHVQQREDMAGIDGSIITNPKDWEINGEFNPMFTTNVGPTLADSTKVYLRPETAQLIFADFKDAWENARLKLPGGIAQVGKAFRNEISPREFIFRCREFEQT